MTRTGDGKALPLPPALAPGPDSAASSRSAARDDLVALLRLAGLDAELDRLRRSMASMVGPLERQRSDLAALAELIESDWLQGSTEIMTEQRRRVARNIRTHAELAEALKGDEAGVLAMSRELQKKAAELAEQRESVLARVSQPLRERYEEALQKGHQPALAALRAGQCPGCGATLPDASRRQLQKSLRVVPCPGCLRLLYDPAWAERDLKPPTLRPVVKASP